MGKRGPKARPKPEHEWLCEEYGERPLAALLKKRRKDVSKYEGEMLRAARVAAALRITGIESPTRFHKRARHNAKMLHLARLDVEELELAVEDCAGVAMMDREVAKSLRLKYGTPGGPNALGRAQGDALRAKYCQRNRARRLRETGFEYVEPTIDWTELGTPTQFLAKFIAEIKSSLELIEVSLDARVTPSLSDRWALRDERDVLKGDLRLFELLVWEIETGEIKYAP